MPSPIRVELRPHDPAWALLAEAERAALFDAIGDVLLAIHHIGSTAVPGIHAKPVVDLMPVVRGLGALDARRDALEGLGYQWWGELGLQGRRYCRKDDPISGTPFVPLLSYPDCPVVIPPHLSFPVFLPFL